MNGSCPTPAGLQGMIMASPTFSRNRQYHRGGEYCHCWLDC